MDLAKKHGVLEIIYGSWGMLVGKEITIIILAFCFSDPVLLFLIQDRFNCNTYRLPRIKAACS